MTEAKSINTRNNSYFGLVDADLLDNGTRHPNLVLMKIAGYLRDHGYQYKLIYDEKEDFSLFTMFMNPRSFLLRKSLGLFKSILVKKEVEKLFFKVVRDIM